MKIVICFILRAELGIFFETDLEGRKLRRTLQPSLFDCPYCLN